MNKTVRIVLYVLSIMTAVGVLALLVLSGHKGGNSAAESWEQTTTEALAQTEDAGQQEQENDSSSEMEQETDSSSEMKTEQEASTETLDADTEGSDTTIIFTGDVLFQNAFKANYDEKGIEGVISAELLQELQEADILMVNNEFPFSEKGEPAEEKQFTFECSPSYAKALNEMGVDVVSLANNHTLDYGREALSDTFATLDSIGVLYGGAGESVERAEEVQIIEVNGKKFGFLAVSRVIPEGSWKVEQQTPGIFSCYDDTRLVELVEEAKKECDFLAVYPHWGVEYEAYPEDYQTQIAQHCMEAGADVVVGSHTHCLQGVTYLEGKPVFYSLGNFIFGQNIDQSAIVKVTVAANGDVTYELLPVYASGGMTSLAEGEKGTQILQYMNRISSGATISSDGAVTE
jgi:poly-gamma-glutamate synthesis protein (capsule biosynthesis protein)